MEPFTLAFAVAAYLARGFVDSAVDEAGTSAWEAVKSKVLGRVQDDSLTSEQVIAAQAAPTKANIDALAAQLTPYLQQDPVLLRDVTYVVTNYPTINSQNGLVHREGRSRCPAPTRRRLVSRSPMPYLTLQDQQSWASRR